jgi:hypothetical protein
MTAVLLGLVACAAQADAPAVVTVAGKPAGIVQKEIGGKRTTVVTLELSGSVKVDVLTQSDAFGVNVSRLRKRVAVIRAELDAKLAVLKDAKLTEAERKEALAKVVADFAAQRADLDHLAAEGTLTAPEGVLLLTGTVRLVDRNGKDAALPAAGGAVVEGELRRGTFAFRKGETAKVAIRNGANPVLLIGRAVDARPALAGRVRAAGTLRVGEKGAIRLDVTAVEAGKK